MVEEKALGDQSLPPSERFNRFAGYSRRPSGNRLFRYEPKGTSGVYECDTCDARFYGGPALHAENCEVRDQGLESCTYVFGPREVKQIKDLGYCPLGPLTRDILTEMFPHLLSKPNLLERLFKRMW